MPIPFEEALKALIEVKPQPKPQKLPRDKQ
jgi:hypothetical protein